MDTKELLKLQRRSLVVESKTEDSDGNIIFKNGIKGFFVFFLMLLWSSTVLNGICYTLGINTKKLVSNYDELTNLVNIVRKRLIAFAIDFGIGMFLFYIIYFILFLLGFNIEIIGKHEYANIYFGFTFILIEEVISKNTVGKKVMGIVVLKENFQDPSRRQLLIRNTCKFLIFNQILGVIYIFFFVFDKKNRFIEDYITKTTVVKKKSVDLANFEVENE